MATGPTISADPFVTVVALVGIVILVAALLSGVIERSGLPQVGIFLALGAVLGPFGLGMLQIGLDSPALRVVAILCLVLVLFTDAVTIDIGELRRNGNLALIVLGPGTILTAGLIGLAAWVLLGLSGPAAVILGAALASTDPVILRGLLRSRFLPGAARQLLRLESGLNDLVLLPIVLVAMAFLGSHPIGAPDGWARLVIELLLLGPGAGVAIGVLSVAALDLIRRRIGVLRDYESLYALGVAFAAYAAGEAVHGSGFLAAFAAGLTISALDVELCDCFLEYGETTAEMLLLFAFVLLGCSLIWSGLGVIGPATLAFAAAAILVRPGVYLLSLARTRLTRRERLLVSWFGPRGLSSLLLVLLPVFAGITGSDHLFAVCSLVVLASLVLHGGAPLFIPSDRRAARSPRTTAPTTTDEALPSSASAPLPAAFEPATSTSGLHDEENGIVPPAGPGEESTGSVEDPVRITLDELRRLWAAGEPVLLLDTRTERSRKRGDDQAAGSIRFPPDHVRDRANELGLPQDVWVVPYCA